MEPALELEPVRLVAGELVLSGSERADWLGPERFAGDAAALALALTQAAGAVQPRGAHSLLVQVRRQLARVAQPRRDQDRRYREARIAGGSSAPARPSWGAKPGHQPREDEAPTEAGRSTYVARPGGGYIYGHGEAVDPDPARRYHAGDPVYGAWCEREALEEDRRALDRTRSRGWVPLRQSEVRALMASRPSGGQPVAHFAGTIVARAADMQHAQQREAGHA